LRAKRKPQLIQHLLATAAALALDAAFGYPEPVFRAIGHPVTWIGALIGRLDRRMNRDTSSETARRWWACWR
jgi:adenosylcobinamide-phosphate synthase